MIIPKRRFDAIYNPYKIACVGYSSLFSKKGEIQGGFPKASESKEEFHVSQPVMQLLQVIAEEEGITSSEIIGEAVRRYALSSGYIEKESESSYLLPVPK